MAGFSIGMAVQNFRHRTVYLTNWAAYVPGFAVKVFECTSPTDDIKNGALLGQRLARNMHEACVCVGRLVERRSECGFGMKDPLKDAPGTGLD